MQLVDMLVSTTVHRRRCVAIATLVALAVLTLPSAAARANCNLIPSAVTELGSSLGKVDRPIASPGQVVSVSLDFACNAAAQGFSPVLGNNFVRLVFEPPGSANDPALVTELSVAPLRVSDCGPNRCSTLAFVVPNTDDLLAPVSDGRGLVGPASILVDDGAGHVLAMIDDLYQPTLSCSDRTPDPIFEHFVVLPPPNVLPTASTSGQTVAVVMQAAVDGGGDLIIPIDYTGILPSGNAGPLARILDATWDLPAFESDPTTPITFPDNGFEWIRAFSDVGRAIPPFLEIEGTGEAVSGSVDAAISVLHFQNDDGQGPIFDLGFRLIDGRGPVIINDPVQITIGGAVPLESLTTFADTAVFVVDEAAQGEDLDGDGLLESQIVQIKNVASGDDRNTGQAVTEVSFDSIHKQALANNGRVIAFLQSEAASRIDLVFPPEPIANGERLDDGLRIYNSRGDPIAPSALPVAAEALPLINSRSLAVTDGDLVVFGSLEGDDSFPATELVSRASDDFPGNAGSFDPDLSEDGQQVVFYSGARGFLPESAYVYDETSFSSVIGFDGSAGDLSASTRFDFDFDSWPLTLSSVIDVPVNVSLSGDSAYGNTVGSFNLSLGNSEDGLFVTSDGAAGSYYTCAPGTWPATCDPGSPPGSFEIGQLIVMDAIVPDANVLIDADTIGDPRARKPGNLSQWLVQILGTVTNLDGQGYVAIDAYLSLRPIQPGNAQIYLRDRDTDSLELISRNPFGGAGTNYSIRPSVSGDGDVVAYTTAADTVTNEIDDNDVEDVVRWRRSDQTSEFVSYNGYLGQPGNGASSRGVVSGDGSTIVFVTQATNLFPPDSPSDANGSGDDILIYDVASRTLVDRVAGPGGAQPNGPIGLLDVSWDGNVVAFGSYDYALDPPAGGSAAADVFRFDRTTRELVRVTKAFDGTASDADSGYGVSLGGDDGRYLAFSTDATNLIGDGLEGRHVLVYDHQTGALDRADLTTAGAIAEGSAEDPVMSRDGQRVAFRSDAPNLKGDVGGSATQVYLYDRVTNAIDLYSKGSDAEPQGAPGTSEVALSGDGYSVAWNSNDPGLVPGDANGDIHDVFVRGVELAAANDLNGNGHGGDRVLRVFDANEESPYFRTAAQVQFERASVAAGRVATLTAETGLVPADDVQERVALVAGGVADSNGDGLGDNVGIPGSILPGNTTGGPGQNGLTRYHAEFDVSGIDLARLTSARVRLYTSQPGGSSQSLRFYHVRPPFNGSLDPSDFEANERAISGAPVLPPTASGFVEIDVTSEIPRVLNSGYSIYGFQARSANEGAAGYTAQIRTTFTNVALPPEQRPTLIVEQSGYVGQNADSDADDQVMFVYDGNTDMMAPLGLSARSVQISDQVLCAIVSENDEGTTGAGYSDINGNGIADDGLLFVADLSSYPPDPIFTGLEATQVVASGPYCYFTQPEAGVDRTGDGDGVDQVAVAFDVPTGQILRILATTDENGDPLPEPQELAAAELVAAQDWVAFRTCEADQGRTLNRDADMSDCVMHVSDTRTGDVDNTLRAAEKCTFDGCDPFFEPYRLRVLTNPGTGEEVVTLSFVTFEATQGGERSGEGCLPTSPDPSCDLTTDGDDLDYVVQVFNPTSGKTQAIEVSPETTVPPFPTTSFDEEVILLQLPCEAVALPGVECGAPESPETVTLVVPDSDGDGTFDSATNEVDDNCSDYNPDQFDGDADGLGASCDPDTDPVTHVETTTPEQELPGGTAKQCELNGDGVIDQTDVDIIFGDRGQRARASDPRDPDHDRQITVLDARYCVTKCTNPNCEPGAPGGLTSCGFLGIESLLALVPWWIRRRRKR